MESDMEDNGSDNASSDTSGSSEILVRTAVVVALLLMAVFILLPSTIWAMEQIKSPKQK
jgi:uncharacterized Tic20 family protein